VAKRPRLLSGTAMQRLTAAELVFVDEIFTPEIKVTPPDARAEALRERDHELATAWQKMPDEFDDVLHFAIVTKQTGPLKEYLASSKPLTQDNRRLLVGYLNLLERKRPRGRPPQMPDQVRRIRQAERSAAQLVAREQKAWREQHGRKHVPRAVTDEMIAKEIKLVAVVFNVPADRLSADNVRRELQTGRVKTHTNSGIYCALKGD
jgi:hypothetical protein